jgi:hypothetical protein
MATIDFNQFVSIEEAATLIATNPRARFMLRGEKGIGKSSIMALLAKKLPNYEMVYRDVGTMAEGEAGIPMPNHDTKTSSLYPNTGFRLHLGKPVCIMLDEFTKGTRYVQNMLHPLLERTNPRFGDDPLPEGSIVLMSGNLGEEGLGDVLLGHTADRVVEIFVRKPNADQWLAWAGSNDRSPVLMAWVHETPHVLASYMDAGQEANVYIYNPRKVQSAIVTPRSLDIASDIIETRHLITPQALKAALIGKVGQAAAADLLSYIDYQDQLAPWADITTNPKSTPIPTSAGACSVLVFGAIEKITAETMTPFMTYLERLAPAWQAAFAINVAKNPAKQRIAFSSGAFASWLERNEDLL